MDDCSSMSPACGIIERTLALISVIVCVHAAQGDELWQGGWQKSPQNPVLSLSSGEFDSVYTPSQSVIRDGDLYRPFYVGRIDLIHKYFSIGLATKPAKD